MDIVLTTSVRPSYWLPTCELLWSIVTFCFAAAQNVRDVFALRIVMGFLEAPFAVGVLTIMGSWYTPRGTLIHPPLNLSHFANQKK
jgi:ACS family pantothenate transporter-like MFS transporter